MRFEGEAGVEHWVVLHNFQVVTRYNRSRLYARAVLELAAEIAAVRVARRVGKLAAD